MYAFLLPYDNAGPFNILNESNDGNIFALFPILVEIFNISPLSVMLAINKDPVAPHCH